MKRVNLILLLTVTILCGCSNKETENKISLQNKEVLQNDSKQNELVKESDVKADVLTLKNIVREVNDIRKAKILQEPISYRQYMDENINILTDEQIKEFTTPKEKKDVLTLEEGIEDIENAFLMLQSAYGAYQYFGGEERFEQAKKEALDLLNNLVQEKEKFDWEELQDILCEALDFIIDGHFSIEGRPVSEVQSSYGCFDFDIIKIGNNYFINYSDKYYPILRIHNSESIENYIKYTIDEEGNLIYGIFHVMDSEKANQSSTIEFQCENQTKEINFSWNKLITNTEKHETPYERSEVDGVQMIRISSSSAKIDGIDEFLDEFARYASLDKKSKTLIIDLRGNTGGGSAKYDLWLKRYANFDPQVLISGLNKQTNLSYFATISTLEQLTAGFENPTTSNEKLINEGWNDYSIPGKWLENSNRIYVLIDNMVASSGEGFVALLRTLDNVVFIGSNTRGTSFVKNNSIKYLKYSGIRMYFGEGINCYENVGNQDTIGFFPDIWVSPEKALDLVLKLHNKSIERN